MRGKVARKLRRSLFDMMVASGRVEVSQYEIEQVRKADGDIAQVLVCTGYRKLYKQMKRSYLQAVHATPGGKPDKASFARMRRAARRRQI